MTVMRCRPFFLLSSFFLYFNPAPVLQPFSGTDSPGYRWDTVLCISFLFDKKPSSITCIPPSNDALKPFDGIIQTKKRLGYPNRFCLVSIKKHRSESERCLVREMGLEPTHKHFGILFEFFQMTNYSHLSAVYVLHRINAIQN